MVGGYSFVRKRAFILALRIQDDQKARIEEVRNCSSCSAARGVQGPTKRRVRRDYLASVLPSLAHFPINRISGFTPRRGSPNLSAGTWRKSCDEINRGLLRRTHCNNSRATRETNHISAVLRLATGRGYSNPAQPRWILRLSRTNGVKEREAPKNAETRLVTAKGLLGHIDPARMFAK
jgi:hypothetical protein